MGGERVVCRWRRVDLAVLLLTACVVAIAACSFLREPTEEASIGRVRLVDLEVITQEAATGDGGNAWGGHQCRIVRTPDGVFTAYTVPGTDDLYREWRLVWRRDGAWQVVAQGIAGREPVNLLAGPDGTLYLVGWPSGGGTLWYGKPAGGELEMKEEFIRGVAVGNWPYASAGIDRSGNLCVLSSLGEKPGYFFWAYRQAQDGRWVSQYTTLPHRYCYTYVFPQGKALSLVSTRDVRWHVLGYPQPPETFDYVFNAFGYWHTDDIAQPLQGMAFVEEPPTEQFPNVECRAQNDAYMDTIGRMHILYIRRGASTGGEWQSRHMVLSQEGETLYDGRLPNEAGYYCRIFQDSRRRFYILGSAGVLYPVADDGVTLGEPISLDLGGHKVEYSGYGLSVPRTGTPLSDVMDVVFPSDNGKAWIYFRLVFD